MPTTNKTQQIEIEAVKYSETEIQACIDLLEDFVQNSAQFAHLSHEQKIVLLKVTGQISRPDRDQIRIRSKSTSKL